jgi:hypothetical protein
VTAAVPGRAGVLAELRRREAEISAREARRGAGRGPGADDDEGHLCPVRRCTWRVPGARLMCPGHWRRVPRAIQAAVWRSWDNGSGAGTGAHRAAVSAAIRAVNRQLEEDR